MKTNIQNIWKMPKSPVFVALGWFVAGSFLGFVIGHPPMIQRSCQMHPALQAHFLERQIAFESSGLRSQSSSTASLRGAAPEEPVASSEMSSVESIVSSVAPFIVRSSESSSLESIEPSEPVVTSSVSSAESASSSASALSENTSASSSSAISAKPEGEAGFPAFDHATYPVGRAPNWGAMKTPAEWNRDYDEMDRSDFTALPAYRLADLTTPMKDLLETRDDPETIRILTAKLFYSTRFFGTYNLDAGEFMGEHAGIDLKLPKGMPVGAIAGGRVSSVIREESGLGLHVIVEHRLGDETFYSIYGHLSAVGVREGQDLTPGAYIGDVGSTGHSSGNHLHLQIDRGSHGESPHSVYWPGTTPTRAEAGRNTLNPMGFIATHGR